MRDSCDLYNLTTVHVVKLHANTFKLIPNDNSFTRKCKWFVSFTYLFFKQNDNDNEYLVEFDMSYMA